MTKLKSNKWTVVQHSAMGYKDDPTFAAGLEVRQIITTQELGKIAQLGGQIFNSWDEAWFFHEAEMYPKDYPGIVPAAKGRFADFEIDGLKVYVPTN